MIVVTAIGDTVTIAGWTCTPSPATGTSVTCTPNSALSDGTLTPSVTITDPAGNVSPAATPNLTIDTTAPLAPSQPDMTAATDTGISNTDNITGNSTPNFTLSCETGATVTLWNGVTALATGLCVGGTVTLVPSPALADGSYNITATQTDVAGNVSAVSTPVLVVIVDTVVP